MYVTLVLALVFILSGGAFLLGALAACLWGWSGLGVIGTLFTLYGIVLALLYLAKA